LEGEWESNLISYRSETQPTEGTGHSSEAG
jgi:hypothetical protein